MLTRWRLKCVDEVRHIIRMQLRAQQHTIVSVTARGLGPGRKIKEKDSGGKRESPNRCKLTVPWGCSGLCYTQPPLLQPQPWPQHCRRTNIMLTSGKSSAKPGAESPLNRKDKSVTGILPLRRFSTHTAACAARCFLQ